VVWAVVGQVWGGDDEAAGLFEPRGGEVEDVEFLREVSQTIWKKEFWIKKSFYHLLLQSSSVLVFFFVVTLVF